MKKKITTVVKLDNEVSYPQKQSLIDAKTKIDTMNQKDWSKSKKKYE